MEIQDLNAEELKPYACTSEVKLLRYYEPKPGIFIAESLKVIQRALDAGYEPLSLLAEKKLAEGPAREIIGRCGNVPVYTASDEVLTQITGYRLTGGILCAMRRRTLAEAKKIYAGASRIAVLEDIENPTNIGAIFRSAAALSFDAVLLTRECCDPLYRRAIRVSMGTVFQIPWTYWDCGTPEYVERLKKEGFLTAAMALCEDSVRIDDPCLLGARKLAVILGNEGEGLKAPTLAACDKTVRIPMAERVDSLNVAAASAVAFWQLRKRD